MRPSLTDLRVQCDCAILTRVVENLDFRAQLAMAFLAFPTVLTGVATIVTVLFQIAVSNWVF